MGVFAMCAFGGPSWLAHIARNAMYAPPKRAVFTGTKPECVLESMASQSTLPSQIGNWMAHTWRCLPCVRSAGCRGSHTSQKRDVCATQAGALSGTKPECALESMV